MNINPFKLALGIGAAASFVAGILSQSVEQKKPNASPAQPQPAVKTPTRSGWFDGIQITSSKPQSTPAAPRQGVTPPPAVVQPPPVEPEDMAPERGRPQGEK